MSQAPVPGGISDKSGHAAAYSGFALVLVRALAGAEWAGVTGGTGLAAAALATNH